MTTANNELLGAIETQAAKEQNKIVSAKPKTLMEVVADDTFKKSIAMALPKHVSSDRIVRIIMTEMRKTPKLMECQQSSFLGAVLTVSALGLEVGASMGHAYLIPFENRKLGYTECQLIIGYRGMIDLARRSGQIVSLSARAVYSGDEFSYEYGLNENVKHVPCQKESSVGSELTHVYAVAKLKDGGVQFEVMTRGDIDKIRGQSKSGNYGPWSTHFEEMAKKTAIRRLFKYLPVSIEMQKAVILDEYADANIDQSGVFEGTFEEVRGV